MLSPLAAFRGRHENDPAVLALKAWHEQWNRIATERRSRATLRYPSSREVNCTACRYWHRASGEAYAPDEVDSLAEFPRRILDRPNTSERFIARDDFPSGARDVRGKCHRIHHSGDEPARALYAL
jgi:hypothetical protein